MKIKQSFISDEPLKLTDKKPSGKIVSIGGEEFYKLENYDRMPPFLMSIVSDSDHWMYISSTGGLTAGRKNPDLAIFPYYSDDKIHESHHTTGGKTILRITGNNKNLVWEPFSSQYEYIYKCSRNLYKHITGNQLIFEEINHDLMMSFSQSWMNSEKFGWIRKTEITNLSSEKRDFVLLDGILNILPYGILKTTQEQFSTLMDAYKKSELDTETNLGIFSMSSIPVDRAEPSEALKATTVWSTADDVGNVLLSSRQIDNFRVSGVLEQEILKKGVRSAYLIERKLILDSGESDSHMIIAEVDQDSRNVMNLRESIKNSTALGNDIYEDVLSGTRRLIDMVSRADGTQHIGDRLISTRHFSNVLFNIMRGGIFEDDYSISKNELKEHILNYNPGLLEKHEKWIITLPGEFNYIELIGEVKDKKDPDLYRLVLEYMPLTFSRRHGDPSRPWNRFSIDIKNPDGSRSRSYEGNWRDIFQNWEALSFSFPFYLHGMIAKFLNASTEDGYNPYRITSHGIDWEIQEPDNPWSFIGYWGDHQVIYLLKLMELLEDFFPGSLQGMLNNEIFVYTNVPYRIRPYEDILKDPYNTIDFDEDLHHILMNRAEQMGADGKLVTGTSGSIVYASLVEKLLVAILTRLSNFIPGGGIWMNTQRPEWNDANNALVGYGVSMVTLAYLRRYIAFFKNLLKSSELKEFKVAKEVADFFREIGKIFKENRPILTSPADGRQRKKLVDKLGTAGSDYRTRVYNGFSGEKEYADPKELMEFLELSLESLEKTIEMNQRPDKLFHSYNLIEIERDSIEIKNLQLMLEGQVSVISSGLLEPEEVIRLLTNLKSSDLYREDQDSYMLYPEKELPAFLEKNNLPENYQKKYPVLRKLLEKGGYGIINQDINGIIHFCGEYKNAKILQERISKLEETKRLRLGKEEKEDLFRIYEELFNHHSFTGRSGSFYKYEGLGSIYWHMVSKLLFSVGEYLRNIEGNKEYSEHYKQLKKHFYEIREGIGVHKNPADYGAVPTDPYSHTPSMHGAQQPGMTGQVKEDILSRWIELGLEIKEGEIHISKNMWKQNEFREDGTLSFTYCAVPFTYVPGEEDFILITDGDGKEHRMIGNMIEKSYSDTIFSRSGKVKSVMVYYKNHLA